MRFHEHLVYSFIPDSVEIQRNSFYTLLKKGFIKELASRNPITNETHDLELFFYPQYYQLNRPECTPTEAILKSKSYSCKLYVPVQLTNRQSNEIKLQWVLLGNLPLMTKRGHFIINGSPRVVINQLVRSPGIYYQETIDIKKRKTYYADLISYRGTWLRLEIDKKRRVWARMKKIPKISALVFLQALGFTRNQMKFGIRFFDFLNGSRLKENHPTTTEEALISLYEKSQINLSKTLAREEKPQVGDITPIMGQKFLFRKFMNPRTYNLGLVGRMRLNKKFGISEKDLTLTRLDIFCAINYLINLKFGITSVDDIDNLKNRRVKASGELIQNQLNTGLIRLEKTIRDKMKKVKKGLTIQNLITTKPINGALREFFGSSPLSQYLDQTNPLAEITHKRRLSSLGPGGLSRETAGMAVRSIHPTHYGRICPIETPEGRNAGLVNSMTIHARINSHGFLKTPFYNVYQGQIQKQDSSLRDARPLYFSAEQEELVKVAPGDLKASKLNFLSISKIPIRIEKDYYRVSREQVEYIAMSPIQMISIATSLIPFLEHDDANRALMGSNMQRQAVPIMLPERPIVGTGLEARAAGDSGYVVQSKMGGCVSYASGKKIVILEKSTRVKNTFTISNKFTSQGLLKSKSSMRSFYPFAAHRKQAYSILRKKEHNGHYKENHTAYPFGATFKNDAFVKQEGNEKQSPIIKPLLPMRSRAAHTARAALPKILPIFASQKYQGFMTKFLSEFLVMSLTSRRKGYATPMILKSKIRLQGTQKSKILMKCAKLGFAQDTTSTRDIGFEIPRSLRSFYPFAKAALLYGFYVVEPTHPNKHLTKTYNKNNIVNSLRSQGIKAALSSSKVYKSVFRYKNVEANSSFQKKFTVRLTPCSAKQFAHSIPSPTNKNKESVKIFDFCVPSSNVVFVGQEHKAKDYQKVKISNNLKKPTRELVSLNMNLKYCKENSLINLIFSSLIQSTDFTTNFSTMLLKSKIRLREKCAKLGFAQDTTSKRIKAASFSYIPLKNSSIRSLRSLYKKNQSIFSTNLPKPIGIQNYINKLYLLITSDIWADKSKIYKSKVKNNLKFQLQNRLSKTLSSKKRLVKIEDFKEQQLKSSMKGYKQQRDKSCAKKKMDTQLKQETSKNRLFWASISDKKVDQTSNKNEGLPFNPLLDSLAEVFDNPSEQGVKGYEILMSNLAKNDKTNLKQKLFTSFLCAAELRILLAQPLLLFLLCKTKEGIRSAQKKGGDVRPIIKKDGYFAPARPGYEGLLPPIKHSLLKQIFVSKSEKKEGGRGQSGVVSYTQQTDKSYSLKSSIMNTTSLLFDFKSSFYPMLLKSSIRDTTRIPSSHTYRDSEASIPCTAHRLLRVFDGVGLFPSKGDEVEVGRDINENHNQKIKPIEYSLQNYQRSNQETCLAQRPTVLEGEWVQQGDLLADCTSSVSGDLSLGKNILVAYMPWEGYNFEDAILISERLVYDDIYTSLHIERYEVEIRDTKFGVEQISSQIPDIPIWELSHLDEKGIAKVGCWVKEGDILIGKVTPIKKKSLSPHEKLLYDIVGKKIPTTRNTSLRLPKGVEGRVISVEILETENIPPGISFAGPGRVHVFIAEKRKIQVGDKISGRHGNKGIVSKIIPQQDMPYLPNGTNVDMVLNPLGVPSRMNVGQVFEALLGLAGVYLNQSFKIPSFDETYGPEASRSIVYSKLYEARLKSGQKWLFDPNFPGKTRVFDGRTGQCFDQLVTVGQAYMLKLVHQVDDKIHARSTGPYSLVTQQPLRGRAKHGGQRLGEMEVWALEGFGAAYTLQELLTIKSDDIKGRHKVINSIFTNTPITIGTPEAFKVLIGELQSLCLDPVIYVKTADSTKPATRINNVMNLGVKRKRKKVVKIRTKVGGSTV